MTAIPALARFWTVAPRGAPAPGPSYPTLADARAAASRAAAEADTVMVVLEAVELVQPGEYAPVPIFRSCRGPAR